MSWSTKSPLPNSRHLCRVAGFGTNWPIIGSMDVWFLPRSPREHPTRQPQGAAPPPQAGRAPWTVELAKHQGNTQRRPGATATSTLQTRRCRSKFPPLRGRSTTQRPRKVQKKLENAPLLHFKREGVEGGHGPSHTTHWPPTVATVRGQCTSRPSWPADLKLHPTSPCLEPSQHQEDRDPL